jgi:O-glycosyl hydrolase
MELKYLFFYLLLLSCSRPKATEQPHPVVSIKVNEGKTAQTIHNFAASDAWSCQFVGSWPDEKKATIADWLFSLDTAANGTPKGIGLSLWRYNIGAGSAEQGTASGIGDEWRRAGSVTQNAQSPLVQAQNWFLTAAKKRGVEQFLAFYNSPPVELTKNNKAYANNGVSNISPDNYSQFAKLASGTIKQIENNAGIRFHFLSPVNEPQWDWSDGGQEGSPYTNAEISNLVKSFNYEFANRNTKLIVSEAGQLNYFLPNSDKPAKDDQVAAFFDQSSPNYIWNLPSVYPAIAGHSYFTTSPVGAAMALRKNVSTAIQSKSGLQFWQSEYCILGDNAGEINGSGRDLGMTPALYLARVIQQDLVWANASAWQWWLAISPYDYKDGLIYIDKNKTTGNYYDSKMLWALGNYSRFVRPGMVRVDATADDNDVLVSSFKDPTSGKLVVVIVNGLAIDKPLSLKKAAGAIPESQPLVTYTTNEMKSLEKKMVRANELIAPARSVTTIIVD